MKRGGQLDLAGDAHALFAREHEQLGISGTPGDSTIRVGVDERLRCVCPPSSQVHARRACARASPMSARLSVTVTCAPRCCAELRDREPGLARADDQHLVRSDAGDDVVVHQRTFSVASATSASMKQMIQKRTMTFGSAQPLSSKWWWIGAILKTRLPVSLNEATCTITLSVSTHEHAADR